MKTKKLLVAFNPDKPTAKSSDFLLPLIVEGKPRFLGLSSGKFYDYGMVVMTGKDVTVNDVFAKVVDTGRKIDSVDQMLDSVGKYFELLKAFKISNVLKLVEDQSNEVGFNFEKTSLKASAKKKGLP